MKSKLSLILAMIILLLSFQITIFAEDAEGGYRLQLAEFEVYNDSSAELTASEYVTINVQEGEDSADITAYNELNAVVIKASYNADGILENVNVTDAIKLTKCDNTVKFLCVSAQIYLKG